jgi:hypothetical protein
MLKAYGRRRIGDRRRLENSGGVAYGVHFTILPRHERKDRGNAETSEIDFATMVEYIGRNTGDQNGDQIYGKNLPL